MWKWRVFKDMREQFPKITPHHAEQESQSLVVDPFHHRNQAGPLRTGGQAETSFTNGAELAWRRAANGFLTHFICYCKRGHIHNVTKKKRVTYVSNDSQSR